MPSKQKLELVIDSVLDEIFFLFGDIGKSLKKESSDIPNNVGDARKGLMFLLAVDYLKKSDPESAAELESRERSKELLKALYDVVIKGKPINRWIDRLFGQNPKNEYLIPTSDSVILASKIDPTLKRTFNSDYLDSEECSDYDTICYIEKILGVVLERKQVIIKIKIRDGFEEPRYASNVGDRAYVRFEDLITVSVKTNFQREMCVLWISSNSGIAELYPDIKQDLRGDYEIGKPKLVEGWTKITMPSNRDIEMDTEQGKETCVVVTKENEKFSRDEIDLLKKRLCAFVKSNSFFRAQGDFLKYKRSLKGTEHLTDEMAVAPTSLPEDFREIFTKQFHGFGDRLDVVQIPFDQIDI